MKIVSQLLKQPKLTDRWRWEPGFAEFLRCPFKGAADIKTNYSQAFQDIFVLSMLDGLRNGRYLEVGAHHPVSNNNTYLLHHRYDWSGVSIDIDPTHLRDWRKERPQSTLVIADALAIKYKDAIPMWFNGSTDRIDFLQLDIDPSINTLGVLKALPLDSCRFSVITFETDTYAGDLRAREESRECLSKLGYELIAADVSVLYTPVSPEPIPFEDWWVDPQCVSQEKILAFRANRREAGQKCLPQELLFSR